MHLRARLAFEPFRPGVVKQLQGFSRRQYIRPTATDDPRRAGVETIIRGKFRSSWSDRYNNSFSYKSRVIKEIRTNLIIGWLLETFQDIKIIHIVRDPFATIASQRIGAWPLDLAWFTSQPQLMDDHLDDFRPMLERVREPSEVAVLHWAIENYVPVVQYRSGAWSRDRYRIFSYDRLCEDDDAMLGFLAFAGVRQKDVIWSSVRKPSRVSRGRQKFGRSTDVDITDHRQRAFIERVQQEMRLGPNDL